MNLEGPYDAKQVEDKIYKLWEESGFFGPDGPPSEALAKEGRHKKPFTIIMPPANANGNLHAGHALVMTIEDIMTRYKRMQGFGALWLPGMDHAGFETQVVYEKKLEKEGKSRFKMGREELYNEILQFTLENKKNIEGQIKKMGASVDWSREKFTLDSEIVKIVYSTFEKLFGDGLVYRGKKIINWCVKHQTSLSDLETKDTEKTDKLYYLKYGPFTIATARPETKFGDKYVVMHPNDPRYKGYKQGDKLSLEWINGPITATVVKDEAIDMEFGTGAMTITPWHDAVDFEIAQKHNLDKEQIIDFYGKLLPVAGEFAGMKIIEAREKIIEKLQVKGLVEKIEESYQHVVKTCYKCDSLIEPQIKEQWFLKMAPLAKPAIKAIESGKVVFIPENYKKIILHWLKNIMDWPLSRQIVWGIPIPVKTCEKCSHAVIASEAKQSNCEKCGGNMINDPDTFDTWFSSGQWPFATLLASGRSSSKVKSPMPTGRQEKSKVSDDFKNFYPTDVMETGGDLIFFWISRMIMLGLYITKKVPFKTVYIHGMVLDAKGQKMSKSKGNVINPMEISEKFGTDALRMGLIIGNTPGTSLALDENKIKGYKNFANKIWNASKFVLMNIKTEELKNTVKLTPIQKKYLKELKGLVKETTKLMDSYKFYIAGEKIYHYFWHTFCDKIIEESKLLLADPKTRQATQYLLLEILITSLKLLHPFMPFITEEIYQQLPIEKKKEFLMVEKWPT